MGKDRKEELKRLQDALLQEELPAREPPRPFPQAGRLYNTDKTDTDLHSFSEAVLAGRKRRWPGLLLGTVVVLALAAVIWWFVHNGGNFT